MQYYLTHFVRLHPILGIAHAKSRHILLQVTYFFHFPYPRYVFPAREPEQGPIPGVISGRLLRPLQ